MKPFFTRRSGSLFFLLLMLTIATAEAQFSMVQRNVWEGPFDITTVGAPNLMPVYVNESRAQSGALRADSLITDKVITRTGDLLNQNNRYAGGSPFQEVQLPATAYCASDPSIDVCTNGLVQSAPNASCPTKYSGQVVTYNKLVGMTYADFDQDLTTYSSSMAKLEIPSCSKIQTAYLYWAGNFRGTNPSITLADGPLNTYSGTSEVFDVTSSSPVNMVKFKAPGSTYQTVTASSVMISNSGYACIADVTTLIQGSSSEGEFWVGNILSYPQAPIAGSSSGWALVIVYKSPDSNPKQITLWDGYETVSGTKTITLPNAIMNVANSNHSFIGFGALDGEGLNNAPQVGVTFQTNGGAAIELNPFLTDQPPAKLYTTAGLPSTCAGIANLDACKKPLTDGNWCNGYDNFISSKISLYSEINDKNGNDLIRLPSNKNTLGFDLHHAKLPNNAIGSNTTNASLTFDGTGDEFQLLFAYIALEKQHPKLEVAKFASANVTTPGSSITYRIQVKNTGNASLSSATIKDTLDIVSTYVESSLSSNRYVNGVVSPGTVTLNRSDNILDFTISTPIEAGDSLDIVFEVNVKPYAGNTMLWDTYCKRTVYNRAWARYLPYSTAMYTNLAPSNERDCEIGTDIKILISGFSNPITESGPFDFCNTPYESILEYIRYLLISQGVSSTVIEEFDIRTSTNVRVRPEDLLSTITKEYYMAFRNFSSSGSCQEIFKFNIECGSVTSTKDEIAQQVIQLYPNPSEGHFTIELKENAPIKSIEIMDMDGVVVFRKLMDTTSGLIKVSDLSSGIYIAKIETKAKTFYKKVIVY